VSLISCDIFEHNKYSEGTFPDKVTNLGAINSPDDDYNSMGHSLGNVMALMFSSKRGGRSDFNFVNESLNFQFDQRNGKFSFDNQPYGGLDVVEEHQPLNWATSSVNSNSNELGPYLRSYNDDLDITHTSQDHFGEYLLLFASDRIGNLDVYMTHNYQDSTARKATAEAGVTSRISNKRFVEPIPIPFLNSAADDAYPTFDKTYGAIYFTSNRDGSFDIFKAVLPAINPMKVQSRLPSLQGVSIEKVAGLSSSADDKCPFINGNKLVFTSNRPGGYGGYDLYYSTWEGNRWSEPVNFGAAINTAYDEYRPILQSQMQFSNQLMIFSSNRPGGKGGFDLYMVGVPR
jgi:hypothetical protein